MKIEMKPIGFIKSPFINRSDITGNGIRDEKATAVIEMLDEFKEGISDIKEGSNGVILFYFHKSEGYKLNTFSHKAMKNMGVFSTRSPFRPNGIGMSVVKFLKITENIIEFEGVDMLDGTPVLDIKPSN